MDSLLFDLWEWNIEQTMATELVKLEINFEKQSYYAHTHTHTSPLPSIWERERERERERAVARILDGESCPGHARTGQPLIKIQDVFQK